MQDYNPLFELWIQKVLSPDDSNPNLANFNFGGPLKHTALIDLWRVFVFDTLRVSYLGIYAYLSSDLQSIIDQYKIPYQPDHEEYCTFRFRQSINALIAPSIEKKLFNITKDGPTYLH